MLLASSSFVSMAISLFGSGWSSGLLLALTPSMTFNPGDDVTIMEYGSYSSSDDDGIDGGELSTRCEELQLEIVGLN